MKEILSLKGKMEFQSTFQLHIRVIFSTIEGTPEEEGDMGERH